jgi:RNA polymerase sigma-54 factor
MKPSLQVRLSQHLALTPQLQQSIRLLQLSTLELHQEVEQMLEQNPFLEADEESGGGPEAVTVEGGSSTAAEREDWSAPGTDSAGEVPADTGSSGDGEGAGVDQLDFEGGDAGSDWDSGQDDYLRSQLRGMRLAPEDQLLVEALIDSLTEDGYLADPLEEIAERLAVGLELGEALGRDVAPGEVTAVDLDQAELPEEPTPEEAQAAAELREELLGRLRCALGWLQNLEPCGVGARDLGECLVLQLREHDATEARRVAILICQGHLELLARRDMKKLVAATGADEDDIRDAQSLIVTLEPKPGRRFARAEANIVVPDVIVQKAGRGWRVVLNPDVMPRLRINDMYAQALRQHRGQRGADDAGSGATLSARLQEARWFVKNILQRFDTIQRVSQAIVERQKGFFTHGEIAMKPLVLREIADELGLHESTISRVTTAKYMATPFGTFELKYFFGSSLNTEAGGNASSTAVRALIKQFVAAEDQKKPLSDSQLSTMLEEQGIQVARRTVAKYREALKIAPANLRKAI